MADSEATMVARLVSLYHETTPEQREEGLGWYRAMRSICQSIADETNRDLVGVVIAMAALSPMTPVARNIALCWAAAKGEHVGHPFANKAYAALDTGAGFDILGNRKTRAFAHNILNAGQSQRVTFDIWAYRAMTGDIAPAKNGRHTHDEKAYRRFADNDEGYASAERIYRLAAQAVGRYPANFQAIVWVATRKAAW